jgi:hypothetical protein
MNDRWPDDKPKTSIFVCNVPRPLFVQDKAWYATPPMRPYPLDKNSRATEGRR